METDRVHFNPFFRSTTKGHISEKVLKCPRVRVVFFLSFLGFNMFNSYVVCMLWLNHVTSYFKKFYKRNKLLNFENPSFR